MKTVEHRVGHSKTTMETELTETVRTGKGMLQRAATTDAVPCK